MYDDSSNFQTCHRLVIQRTTENHAKGIRLTLFSTVEDFDFAYDLPLLSRSQQHIQENITCFSQFAQQICRKISQMKTELMTLNTSIPSPNQLIRNDLPTTR